MVGIQKKCKICEKMFITRSANSARWESHCFECFSASKKQMHMINFQAREENIVKGLEVRLVKAEEWMDNIPSIIGAEVNNIMNNIISEELLSEIEKKNAQKVANLTAELFSRIESFEKKIQKQLSLLNSRIVSIMKEMD